MGSAFKSTGIVLRRYPLGEADSILHILSPDRGKIEAVAKGARRIKSPLLAVTQPFVHGEFMLFSGRSLDRLAQAEIITSYRRLREDLDLFAICSFCAELVDRLTPAAEPAPEIYQLIKDLFDYLHSAPIEQLALVNALSLFRILLVEAAGYRIDFTHCLQCGNREGLHSFSIKEGGPLCLNCTTQDASAVKITPAVLQCLGKLPSLGWPKLGIIKLEDYLQEIESLLDAFYLYHLEVEPRSSAFLYSLRR